MKAKALKGGGSGIHPDVRIGHVHLKVADLERSLEFYRETRNRTRFDFAARLSSGGSHRIWTSCRMIIDA